jgi:oligoendopeptidase F
VRTAAYRELNRVYQGEASVLGQIFVQLAQDWYSEKVQLRGHPSPIAARNAANELSDVAVEVLLDTVRDHAPLVQRYFTLKARQLGVKRLDRCDLYAPMTASASRMLYADGVSFVLETFGRFDPLFARHAARVVEERHVDSEPRPGKWSGDFCSTVVPRLTPWVLVNYHGRMRDVASLAHELGHAVHGLVAADAGRSALTQQPGLALAETGSVFCEALITDRLYEGARDAAARREVLCTFLDGAYATVFRQAALVRFELAAHEAVRRGASVDDLAALYLAILREQLGDAVSVSDDFRFEWLGVHQIFHSPFYCYAYSFGHLLALALYRRYRTCGEVSKTSYLALLAAGGSIPAEDLLRQASLDVTSGDVWAEGFGIIAERLDELEALLA